MLFPDEKNPTDVVVTGAGGNLYRINAEGAAVFQYKLGDPIGCSPAVGDLDGDGFPEIVYGTDVQKMELEKKTQINCWKKLLPK